MVITYSTEPKRIIRKSNTNFSDKSNSLLYMQALDYLIRETGNAGYIVKQGSFCYENGQYSPALKFDSDDEFYFRATADGKRLSAVYDELYGFEITKLIC